MAKTLAEKIPSLKSHSEAKAGEVVVADVDLACVQHLYSFSTLVTPPPFFCFVGGV